MIYINFYIKIKSFLIKKIFLFDLTWVCRRVMFYSHYYEKNYFCDDDFIEMIILKLITV